MASKDRISLGMSLPHRSPEPIDMATVRRVAERAEALGFSDLWVTGNSLDWVCSFDPGVIPTYAAKLTTRIRVGVSVSLLPVHDPIHMAHRVASLDYASGGRAILGIGLGRRQHYAEFQVPMEHRVRRFREGVEVLKALWTRPRVDYHGSPYRLDGAQMVLKPVQKPHPPIRLGGDHPDAVRRAAALGDAWMGSGASGIAEFGRCVPVLRAELERLGRDRAAFPISKRVFLSVDERADRARSELTAWFGRVYRDAGKAETSGIYVPPEQVRERLDALVSAGASHLLLDPVGRYEEQLEALAGIPAWRDGPREPCPRGRGTPDRSC